MKMTKKLLAIVLAGVMALTVLTGCGNSTGTGSIADAMSDMLKAQGMTVKSDSKLNTKAQEIVTALDKNGLLDDVIAECVEYSDEYSDEEKTNFRTVVMEVMKDYKDQFVLISVTKTKGYNTTAQAYNLWDALTPVNYIENKGESDTAYIGTTTLTKDGTGYRFAVFTVEAIDEGGEGEDGEEIQL